MTGSSAPKRHKAPLGIDAGGYIIDRMPATYMMDTDGAPLRQSKRWRGRDARIHVCKCSEYSLFPCCNVDAHCSQHGHGRVCNGCTWYNIYNIFSTFLVRIFL